MSSLDQPPPTLINSERNCLNAHATAESNGARRMLSVKRVLRWFASESNSMSSGIASMAPLTGAPKYNARLGGHTATYSCKEGLGGSNAEP
eukprot:scaffold59269_cov28-Tisochrysis_lutea.AAC.2